MWDQFTFDDTKTDLTKTSLIDDQDEAFARHSDVSVLDRCAGPLRDEDELDRIVGLTLSNQIRDAQIPVERVKAWLGLRVSPEALVLVLLRYNHDVPLYTDGAAIFEGVWHKYEWEPHGLLDKTAKLLILQNAKVVYQYPLRLTPTKRQMVIISSDTLLGAYPEIDDLIGDGPTKFHAKTPTRDRTDFERGPLRALERDLDGI